MDALWSSADWQMHFHIVLCGDLYTACVDVSRTVFWDRSLATIDLMGDSREFEVWAIFWSVIPIIGDW